MRPVNVMVLWLPSRRCWRQAVRLRMADVSWPEYMERIEVVAGEAEAQGLPVVYCRATPRQVLARLREMGLSNTPDGRAAAYATLIEVDDAN